MRLAPSDVAVAAGRLGLRVEKPLTLKGSEPLELLRGAGADVLVVAAYGLLLPPAILEAPPRGCINIHASLLPRWRGAAPIQRAILAGDETTGVSIMQMDPGLDTGPVLLQSRVPIEPTETTGSLTAKLALAGAEAIVKALRSLDNLVAQPQDPALATHAPKISKREATVDWSMTAEQIERQVRAFNPSPGAHAIVQGLAVKILEAGVLPLDGIPGSILRLSPVELVLGCGSGALSLRVLQRPGSRRMPVAEFLRGNPWPACPA